MTAFALIQELIFRDGLRIALGGRDDVTLEPILNFLARHIDDSRFGGMAAEVADVLIGEYRRRDPTTQVNEAFLSFSMKRHVQLSTWPITID